MGTIFYILSGVCCYLVGIIVTYWCLCLMYNSPDQLKRDNVGVACVLFWWLILPIGAVVGIPVLIIQKSFKLIRNSRWGE